MMKMLISNTMFDLIWVRVRVRDLINSRHIRKRIHKALFFMFMFRYLNKQHILTSVDFKGFEEIHTYLLSSV